MSSTTSLVTEESASTTDARSIPRSSRLDRLRGLAVVLMVADHLLIVSGQETHPLRYTVTRAAMPLFFLIAGHLFRGLRPRHALIFAAGCALPYAVPWIDTPNVLVWYVVGCLLLALALRLPEAVRPFVLTCWVLLPITLFANGYATGAIPGSYNGLALVGIMALGMLLPRAALLVPLPAFLSWAGRWPLAVYVGHLLILEGVSRVA